MSPRVQKKKKTMQKFNLKNIKFFAKSLFDFHLSNDEIFLRIKFRSKLGRNKWGEKKW